MLDSLKKPLWKLVRNKFKSEPPQPIREWLSKNIRLSKDMSILDGNVELFGYQVGLAIFMTDLRIKRFAFRKPSQIGYSLLVVMVMIYDLVHRQRNVAVWNPTESDSREFYNQSIKPILRENQSTIAQHLLVGADNYDLRHPSNQSSLIKFIGATLYNRHAHTATQYRRIHVSLGINDEIDGMPWNIDGEGSPDSLLRERTNFAFFPKEINGSTPTLGGQSSIERLVENIAEIFHREVPCPSCGAFQILYWGASDSIGGLQFTVFRDENNDLDIDRTAATAHYQCEACQHHIEYSQLRSMDRRGRWISKNYRLDDQTEEFYNNETGDITDPPVEDAAVLSAIYSYTLSWSEGVRRFLHANELMKSGDNSEMITWINHYLGEAYYSKSIGERVTWNHLHDRRENYLSVYGAECPGEVQYITAWADIQKDRIEYEIVGWGYGEESWVLDYQVLQGSPIHSDVLSRYGNDVLERVFIKPSGERLTVNLGGIDSGHWSDQAYAFCHQMNVSAGAIAFVPTKGDGRIGLPVVNWKKLKRDEYPTMRLLLIGTELAKDMVFERYAITDPGAGRYHIPELETTGQAYCKGKVAEIKTTTYKLGRAVERYMHLSRGTVPNEPLDTAVGNTALMKLALSHFGVRLVPMVEVPTVGGGVPGPVVRAAASVSGFDPASVARSYK